MRIPLIGSSYSSFSVAAAAQQSMNCYLETIEAAGEKNKAVLRGIPGIHLFKDLSTIPAAGVGVRGLWSGGGRLFVATGATEFEVSSAGALVGTVWAISNASTGGTTNSPVQFFANGNQLFFVSGGTAYCDNGAGPTPILQAFTSGKATSLSVGGLYYLQWSPIANSVTGNLDNFDVGLVGQPITFNGAAFTVATVISPTLLTLTTNPGIHADKDWSGQPSFAVVTGAFLDGYYIVQRPNSRQFNISPLNNGMGKAGDGVWTALDYDIKGGYPDYLAAVWAEPPLLYLLGTETLEIWRDTGNADFPFQRVDGGFAHVGLAAIWSPVSIGGKLHMLAGGTFGQTVAVRMEGVTPVRISTHAQEEAWAAMSTISSTGISYSYVDRGHWFWVINFTGGSWVYDATESARLGEPQWHQRARYAASAFNSYRPWYHTFIPEWGTTGKHIVGDPFNSNLYEMSSDFFDDNGTDIRAQRAMSHLYNGGNRMFMSRIEIEHEAGMSWNAGANFPVMNMDFSDDRGHTFGTPRSIATGAAAAYKTRSYLNRCGSFRDRVSRLNIQGQSKVAIIDINAEVEMGSK